MRLTRQTDYAIRVALDLAGQPGHGSDVRAIAGRQCVPEAYAAKIVQALARAGLVVTARGARGGVRLARDPAKVTLLEIVEAAEGPTLFTRCMLWPGECPPLAQCALHPILDGLREAVQGYLQSMTLEELARRAGPQAGGAEERSAG
ncbi:Rrf2 family transcriptional regulator [Carboxydochorda subterranea]|uniref:Rrf2 family transcriptional regulator n=1 Tax=Carboxydichorda subterranea TaxID=3109565 RepID=A0ABZ1BYV8_9FIRM|nr:Rrf2 family transcriptional regulator [Limnochorda sp. L945t]WRP17982.1 Rrf2 family transcriptional regulator [Limnochorda sp. L945t]